MRVVILVDWEACRYRPSGNFETLKGTEQYFVANGLVSRKREVIVLPFEDDLLASVARLRQVCPDVVFNLTASLGRNRTDGHIVAAVLDLLGVPYTGANAYALMLCLDKAVSKMIVQQTGVRTPDFTTLDQRRSKLANLRFPLIVKPRFGESSEFLSSRSIVKNGEELANRVNQMFRICGEPLICEEFIDGRDISVCVLGNEKLRVLPPREFHCDNLSKGAPRFETHRVKHSLKYQAKWNVRYTRANLTGNQANQLIEISKRIYRALGLRDYGRLDFRLANNTFYFLEANAHPDLSPSPHSTFGNASSWAGIRYNKLLKSVISMALKRSMNLCT